MIKNNLPSAELSPGNCAVVYIRDVDENGGIVVDCHVFADSESDMATVAAITLARVSFPADEEEPPICGRDLE